MALSTNITAQGPSAQAPAKTDNAGIFNFNLKSLNQKLAKNEKFQHSRLFLSIARAFKNVIDGVKVLHSQHTSNERQNAFLSNFSPLQKTSSVLTSSPLLAASTTVHTSEPSPVSSCQLSGGGAGVGIPPAGVGIRLVWGRGFGRVGGGGRFLGGRPRV